MEIIIYRCTGRHSIFSLPKKVCRECDTTVSVIKQVVQDYPEVKIRVRSWFDNLVESLLKGGWHCPVVTMDGKIFSQGIVPNKEELKENLENARSIGFLRGGG